MAEPTRKRVTFADPQEKSSDSLLGNAPPAASVNTADSEPAGCALPVKVALQDLGDKMISSMRRPSLENLRMRRPSLDTFRSLGARSSSWSLRDRLNPQRSLQPIKKVSEDIPELDQGVDLIGSLDDTYEQADLDQALEYYMPDHPENYEYPTDPLDPKKPKKDVFLWFKLPFRVKLQIYEYCFPPESRKVSLSRPSLTAGVFSPGFFASPWDILDDVWGISQSCQAWRNEVYAYFWSQYHFFLVLNDFSGPVFNPLSHQWMTPYLPIIQRLTIERDYTKLAGSYKKGAEQLSWKLSAKSRDMVRSIVDGLLTRDLGQKMAGLHIMARQYEGLRTGTNRPWAPCILEDNCASVVDLHPILKRLRVSGFSREFSISILEKTFQDRIPAFFLAIPEDNPWRFPPPSLESDIALSRTPSKKSLRSISTKAPSVKTNADPPEAEESSPKANEGNKLKKKKKPKKKGKKGKACSTIAEEEDIEGEDTQDTPVAMDSKHSATNEEAKTSLTELVSEDVKAASTQGALIALVAKDSVKSEEDTKPKEGAIPTKSGNIFGNLKFGQHKGKKPGVEAPAVPAKDTINPEKSTNPEEEANDPDSKSNAVDAPLPCRTPDSQKSLLKSLAAMNELNEQDDAFRTPLATIRRASDAAASSQPATVENRRTTMDNSSLTNRTQSSAFNRFGFGLGKDKAKHRTD